MIHASQSHCDATASSSRQVNKMAAAEGKQHGTAATSCADAAIQQLCQGGVEVCFANPGTTEMWLVSALEKQPGIRSVLGLHEAVCTGACDGYARIARKPALALLHLGPGLSNGLCNCHNARRAGSPMLVVVGDMARWHRAADPPLNQNIEALASTVSGAVLAIPSAEAVSTVISAALEATKPPRKTTAPALTAAADVPAAATNSSSSNIACCPRSRVVTVIFPHDITWMPAPDVAGPTKPPTAAVAPDVAGPTKPPTAAVAPDVAGPTKPPTAAVAPDVAGPTKPPTAAAAQLSSGSSTAPNSLADSPAACQFLADCAAALRQVPKGKAALVLGGAALLSEGGALASAGRIAASLGAALLCETLPSRIDRGAGLPHASRIAYFPQEASQQLNQYDVLLLVDVRRPVAQFGYKDGPSQLLKHSDDALWELDAAWCAAEALALLEAHIPCAARIMPGVNCRGMFADASRPPLLTGHLTAAAMCQTIAALQPEGTIMVDESLTSGTAYWEASKGCAPFSHLCLTGGAIGSGPPMATGAAVAAAPGQQVINLQADGSAMYTMQALWTQAREQLKVLTIVCANSTYAILKVEAMRQRTGSNALTSISGPDLDWLSLASGMGVPAARAETAEQLAAAVQQGLDAQGPFLIQAVLK